MGFQTEIRQCSCCGHNITVELGKRGTVQTLHKSDSGKSECQIMSVHMLWIPRVVDFLITHGTLEAMENFANLLRDQEIKLRRRELNATK